MEDPKSREFAALAVEWLKTLVLMQSLPNGTDCRKGLMSRLLEAILMVLSGTKDAISQEARELRSNTIRLVSSLAQIPSVATNLKDVMLGKVVHEPVPGEDHDSPSADSPQFSEDAKEPVEEFLGTHTEPNKEPVDVSDEHQSSFHPSVIKADGSASTQEPLESFGDTVLVILNFYRTIEGNLGKRSVASGIVFNLLRKHLIQWEQLRSRGNQLRLSYAD